MASQEHGRERPREIPHWYDPHSETLTLVEGDGAYVSDDEGREYLDFISQLYCVNLGHSNDTIKAAIADQLEAIPYVSSSKRTPVREQLADRLAEVAPGTLSKTLFSISGSEANELAIHLAREYTDAPKVLTRWQSYHGATYGSGALTGDPETRATLQRHAATTGYGKFLPPLPEAFDTDDPETLARRAADHLEFVIQNEDPDSVAAVLMEPVAGTSGAYTAPGDYFKRVREICNEYDVLFISDEVIAGFGRCGEWFGIQTEDVVPDMLTFAKGATSAYAPLAGVMVRPELGERIEDGGVEVGQTFGGHPIACAAGVAAIDAYADGVIEHVREHEPLLADRLHDLKDDHDVVHAIHGRGFHRGVEFADSETGDPLFHPWVESGDNPVDEVIATCREHGVLIGGGRPRTQVILSPPLITDPADLHEGIDVLDEAIEAVFG